jgi:hypothetical protein
VGGNRRFTILSNGNIGIWTISPQTPLFVDGPANSNGLVRLGGGFDYGSSTVLSLAPGTISFDAPGVSGGRFTIIGSNGNVGIGIANPNEKLAVNGIIRSKEVKVENTLWPDYVFSTDLTSNLYLQLKPILKRTITYPKYLLLLKL